MCFSFESSISTFILGSILNVLTVWFLPTDEVIAVSLGWQFAICMQLWDALIWLDVNGDCSEKRKTLSSYALAFNIMQPPVVFLCCIFLKNSLVRKKIATLIILLYLLYSFVTLSRLDMECVEKSCDENGNFCNLHYAWWDTQNFSGIIYLVTLLSINFLLLPGGFALSQCILILVTLCIAQWGFQRGHPSIWCFFAAFSPLFTGICFKLTSRNN